MISIGDLGIGIFESLKPFYYEYEYGIDGFEREFGPLWNEPKALDITFSPKVSSKGTGVGGLGLRRVLEAAKESRGSLVCRTGTSKIYLGYWHGQWRTELKTNLDFFPGTQLEVKIPMCRPSGHRVER